MDRRHAGTDRAETSDPETSDRETETHAVTITLPRSILIIVGLYCFLAGLAVGNAFVAHADGRSPIPAIVSAVLSLGVAIQLVRDATRPPPVGPVPRSTRISRSAR